MSCERREETVEPEHSGLSIASQCELLRISRSSWYYEAKGKSELNLELMRLIDEQFMDTPYYGTRQKRPGLRKSRLPARRALPESGMKRRKQGL